MPVRYVVTPLPPSRRTSHYLAERGAETIKWNAHHLVQFPDIETHVLLEVTSGDRVIATISKKWVTLSDTFGVDIADSEDDLLVLMTVVALKAAEADDWSAAATAISGEGLSSLLGGSSDSQGHRFEAVAVVAVR